MESVLKFWKNIEQKNKQMLPIQVFPAQVKEVDADNRTCTVRVNDNVELYDVKLYAVTDKDLKGFCLLPAKDSQVLVARIANGNDLFVCSFSVVDKVIGTIGDHTSLLVEDEHVQLKTESVTIDVAKDKVTVDADEITFNGGNNDGLIKIAKLTEKINALVDSFNNHTHTIEAIDSTVSVSMPDLTGTGVAAAVMVPSPDNPAQKLDQSAYEDTKIKH